MFCDYELAAKIKTGDKEAFTHLYDKYATKLLGHIYKIVGNKQVAEEILGDVFLTIINKISFFKKNNTKGASFKSWIFRIATNQAIDYLRKQKKEKQIQEYKLENPPTPCIDNQIEIKDKLIKIDTFIRTLPYIQRTVMNLKVIENMTYIEISRVTGISIPMVKQVLFKARTSLRQHLISTEMGL